MVFVFSPKKIAGALRRRWRNYQYRSEIALGQILRWSSPEAKLISQAQLYWNDGSNQHLRQFSHHRGAGIFADETRWRELGKCYLELFKEFGRLVELRRPRRIVDWGCGGGAAAVVFGPETDEYWGVDISVASLNECKRQMALEGLQNFRPLLIDVSAPEAAVRHLGSGTCDLFFSAYVFEIAPTPEYGLRLLHIVSELLSPGGLAIIQIKYDEGRLNTASRRWSYGRNLSWNATYRIADFWRAAEKCGLRPKAISLVPEDTLVDDRNYAWFALLKP
jgi:SAM-dependent methyltransferase